MENSRQQRYNFFRQGTNGRAVLLIHGITGTPSEMNYLGRALHKAGFTVLCNTLPRHCGSLNDLKKVTWQEIYQACIQDFLRLRQGHAKVFVSGLSMGALISLHLAHERPGEISGVIALAPTVFYDGWAVHKLKFLTELAWHIPVLRNAINIRESWPYGLKDEYARRHIERFYAKAAAAEFSDKVVMFGSPFFPLACLYQHHIFSKVAVSELPRVKTPVLIIHAREDDMTSLKNAELVLSRLGAQDKKLVVLEDSYHMVTIDQEKEKVAAEMVGFCNRL
jgi:carboxylesterase